MKKSLQVLLFVLVSGAIYSQNSVSTNGGSTAAATKLNAQEQQEKEKSVLEKPYNESEDAKKRIEQLVLQAQKENKRIILQAGGNWCIWCLRFNQFLFSSTELKNIVDSNFLYYHLNYSPKNKNAEVFASYGNPGVKYGYPVFIILNSDGSLKGVQESSVLEEGKGYSKEKVREFLQSYIPSS